jgi:phosphomevalonate kinase
VKACAPGKVVLSGAYSVLEGAPAIVSAVSRYVHCDSDRTADIVTPEVRAALPDVPAPYFEADALRANGRKLGLGSSAAILVGSLAAVHGTAHRNDVALRCAIEPLALRAHREAQGGGSGIDVAASIWGGTLVATRTTAGVLQVQRVELPPGLVVEVWASGVSASTPQLLASVARFRAQRPHDHAAILGTLGAAAQRAAHALQHGRIEDLLRELHAQREGLFQLGQASQVPIVTEEVIRMAEWARTHAAAVLPSGAGGGDVALWVSTQGSPEEFRVLSTRLGHNHVPLALHARGAHCTPSEGPSHRGT